MGPRTLGLTRRLGCNERAQFASVARELAGDFAREQFAAHGIVADLNVHWGWTASGEGRRHSHVMLSIREASPDLLRLGWNGRCRERFATWEMLVTERQIAHDMERATAAMAERQVYRANQGRVTNRVVAAQADAPGGSPVVASGTGVAGRRTGAGVPLRYPDAGS